MDATAVQQLHELRPEEHEAVVRVNALHVLPVASNIDVRGNFVKAAGTPDLRSRKYGPPIRENIRRPS